MKQFIGSRVLPDLVYHYPKGIQEALGLLKELKGESKVIAGCTDLIPAIRRGAQSFDDGLNMIDVKRIGALCSISKEEDRIKVGAAVRLTEIAHSPIILKYAPVLAEAVDEMASQQIRNIGTVGGNLCTASPAADTAPPLLVLDAQVRIKGIENEKTVPLKDFFLGPGQTLLGPKDILAEIEFPALGPEAKTSRIKLGRRNAFTLSVVSVAITAKIRKGVFDAVRIALGAVAPIPMRAQKAEGYLNGKEVNGQTIEEGAKIAAGEVKPISDVRASAEYRKDMVHVLTKRALTACIE
jgi:carbon-monoxide dehydrogenase medium subunit